MIVGMSVTIPPATSVIFPAIGIIICSIVGRRFRYHHVARTVRHCMGRLILLWILMLISVSYPWRRVDRISSSRLRPNFRFHILFVTLVGRLMPTIMWLVIELWFLRGRLQAVRVLHSLAFIAALLFWVRSSWRYHASHCTLGVTDRSIVTNTLHVVAWVNWPGLALCLLIEYAASLALATSQIRAPIFTAPIFIIIFIHGQGTLSVISLWARSIVRLLIWRWRGFSRFHSEALWRWGTSADTQPF